MMPTYWMLTWLCPEEELDKNHGLAEDHHHLWYLVHHDAHLLDAHLAVS
jgi:hypothetical protein